MATAILCLITMRVVGKQLLSFCNNTGIGILFAWRTIIDSRLHNSLKHFTGFYSMKQQTFEQNSSKRAKIMPMVNAKQEIYFRGSWDNYPSFSAYSCISGPRFCLHTFTVSKTGTLFSQMF